jgi:hypothetical protein
LTASKPLRCFPLEQENQSNILENILSQHDQDWEQPIESEQYVHHQDHGNEAQQTKHEQRDSRPISASANRRDD